MSDDTMAITKDGVVLRVDPVCTNGAPDVGAAGRPGGPDGTSAGSDVEGMMNCKCANYKPVDVEHSCDAEKVGLLMETLYQLAWAASITDGHKSAYWVSFKGVHTDLLAALGLDE